MLISRNYAYLHELYLSPGTIFISRNYTYLQELYLSPGTILISRNYAYLQELYLSPGTILISRNYTYLQELCLSPGTILISMDDTYLYTNVSHYYGTCACREVWNSCYVLIGTLKANMFMSDIENNFCHFPPSTNFLV